MIRLFPRLVVALAVVLTMNFSGPAFAQAPARACCLPNSTCIVATACECTQAGGTFRPLSSDCGGEPCTTTTPLRSCCLPNGCCALTTAYECNKAGGTFRSLDACDIPCTTIRYGSIGMSQTAARRLVREGVVHTLQIQNALDFYALDSANPIWDLMIPTSQNGSGAVVAVQLPIAVRDHVGETIAESAQAAAAGLVLAVYELKANWDMYHENDGIPFYWSLRLDALGVGSDWNVGPGRLPSFTNHKDDVVGGRLSRQRYIDWAGKVVSANGTTLQIADNQVQGFYTQFPSDYFTEPFQATITIDGVTRNITGFNPGAETITVSGAFPGDVTNEDFTTARVEVDEYGNQVGLYPCYFFKNGAADMEAWVTAFCDAWREARPGIVSADPEIGDPVAVTVSDEDLNLGGIDYTNYYEVYYNSNGTGRASDQAYRIDENHTLQEWHAAFAKDRSGAGFDSADFNPTATDYSPLNIDVRSYLLATISTAYNYHRERSTWRHFRTLWPRAHLSQYQLGNSYGVTVDVGQEHVSVPFGPGEEVYHGSRDWHGSITWDAYHCLANPTPEAWNGPDGGIVPMGYTSAYAFEGTVAAWNSNSPRVLTVNPAGINSTINQTLDAVDLVRYLANFEVFVQLPENGVHGPHIFKVTAWNGDTRTFTLDPQGPPLSSVSADDEFVVYYPSFPYEQYIDTIEDPNPIKWSLLQSYCDRYEEPISEAGFLATSKHWAAERARAHTRAHPEKPYTVYYGPGTQPNQDDDQEPPNTLYNGLQERVSFLVTYPHNPNSPLVCNDGWLEPDDWYRVALQAMNFGVNDFVWFVPQLAGSPIAIQTIVSAIRGVQGEYLSDDPNYKNLQQHYKDIACIADWDQSGLLSHDDVKDYYTAYLAMDPIADLNNDGDFTEADVAIFEAADDCGLERDCNGNGIPDSEEIALGDLDPNDEYPDLDVDPEDGRIDGCQNCAADWDVNNIVEVSDIFAFLTAWFNNDPTAQNFGGTPGVSAIFAFLTVWFAHGVGECGA